MSENGNLTLGGWLAEPYRARTGQAERWGIAVGSGLFIFLFLLIFQPFGLWAYEGDLLALTFGYGACTFVITAVLNVAMPRMMRGYFSEGSWTTGKEITWNLVNLFGVALGNILFTVAMDLAPMSFRTIFTFTFYTMAVGVFPIGAGIFINTLRLSRKNQRISTYVTRELEKLQQPAHTEAALYLSSATGKDQITLLAANVLYFSAADNYVEVHYQEGQALKRHLLRNTMKQMEAMVAEHTGMVRCHKSYIVNLDHIRSVSGNAQGCLLMLDSFGIVVPASRQMRQSLRERLADRP